MYWKTEGIMWPALLQYLCDRSSLELNIEVDDRSLFPCPACPPHRAVPSSAAVDSGTNRWGPIGKSERAQTAGRNQKQNFRLTSEQKK